MTNISIYQVDAFTDKVFGGNYAAVCPLPIWLDDTTLQNIAAENNLPETAFIVPESTGNYHIRWFTPTEEVDLCGHATLATAFVIFNYLNHPSNNIQFNSLSGPLNVKKSNIGYTLDFPVWSFEKIDNIPRDLVTALGNTPLELYKGPDWVAIFNNSEQVRNLKPDMNALAAFKQARGVIASAKSEENNIDFVSRCFFPGIGIPEDPVTGSAHCILTSIWAEKTGKETLQAKQISKRGGELLCTLKDDRVEITGQAILYMHGQLTI